MGNQMLDEILAAYKFLNEYAKGDGGEIHKFVKGLILSNLVMDSIRSVLSPEKRATWGQIRDGDKLSKEIDAIVFRGEIEKKWSDAGYGKDIGYAIVPSAQVIAAVETRGADNEMTFDKHEKMLKEKLKPFCTEIYQVYLTAESKKPLTTDDHRSELKRRGYKDVFYLSSKGGPNVEEWERFVETMRRL